MAVKQKNTKKKMALLGLKKDNDGDYRYIDPDDTTSEFVPVRNRNKNKENKFTMSEKEFFNYFNNFLHPLCESQTIISYKN